MAGVAEALVALCRAIGRSFDVASLSTQREQTMELQKLNDAVTALAGAADRIGTTVDGVASELIALRAQVNAQPPADTGAQSSVDAVADRISGVADAINRASATMEGVAATGSGSSATPGAPSDASSPSTPSTPADTAPLATSGVLADGRPDPLNPSA